MSRTNPLTCDDAQMAVVARLDGEAVAITPADVERHLADCHACRAAVADLTTVHATLDRLIPRQLDVDLWPMVRSRLRVPSQPLLRSERGAIVGLIAGVSTWRIAQLLFDLPAPVLNSMVPLALIIIVLWRCMGDPFAIRVTPLQVGREGTL